MQPVARIGAFEGAQRSGAHQRLGVKAWRRWPALAWERHGQQQAAVARIAGCTVGGDGGERGIGAGPPFPARLDGERPMRVVAPARTEPFGDALRRPSGAAALMAGSAGIRRADCHRDLGPGQ